MWSPSPPFHRIAVSPVAPAVQAPPSASSSWRCAMAKPYQKPNRINRYLRAAGLELLKVSKPKPGSGVAAGRTPVCHVEGVAAEPSIPDSLRKHRHNQRHLTESSDQLRAQIARTKVAKGTRHPSRKRPPRSLTDSCYKSPAGTASMGAMACCSFVAWPSTNFRSVATCDCSVSR